MARASTIPEPSEEPWATEERAFRHQRGRLLRRYAGQFVALYQEHVVGHGVDDEALAQGLGSTGDWRIQSNSRQVLGKEGSLLACLELLAERFHMPER